jgi:transposase
MKSIEKSKHPEVFGNPSQSYGYPADTDGTLALKIESLASENESLTLEVESLRMKNAEQEAKIKFCEEQLRLAAAKKYGASSEKNPVPEQLSIFNEAEKESREDAKEPTLEEITHKRRLGTRKATSEKYGDPPVEETRHELSEEERVRGRRASSMAGLSCASSRRL